MPEGEVLCEAGEGSQRARGAMRGPVQIWGLRGRGGWEGEVPELGVACLRRQETEAGG